MKREKRTLLRLPDRLIYTALHIAVVGSVACSGETKVAPADASGDGTTTDSSATDTGAADNATGDTTTRDSAVADTTTADSASSDSTITDAPLGDAVAQDSPLDGESLDACNFSSPDAPFYYCGPAVPDASCPGAICDLSLCPLDAGCEPFV